MPEKNLQPSSKPVAIWLLVGVGMIIIQVVLGGITRLTGSGLSITEWDVITGSLPPLNHQQWLAAFDKYRQTPQFNLLNFDFTLQDFKFIFFWEWFHRLWARLIGLVFAVPFIIFLLQRRFKPGMIRPMLILFLLGALQGVVGWIMVASGLTGDAVYVAPVRLALHFILALGLLSYTFWFALQLMTGKDKFIIDTGTRSIAVTGIFILVIQLFFGALMAGYKAATAAPTWPDINGHLIPSGLFSLPAGFMNLFQNKITIHFIHRSLAYILLLLVIGLSYRLFRSRYRSSVLKKTWPLPLLLILIQVVLGILSVLTSPQIVPGQWGVFEWLAQLHQLSALFLLLSLIWTFFLFRKKVN
ncbi:MAG: heme A synthase [Terrimonas sp.]|nr:heme A synthase [Terrimonas sp.]